MFIAGQVQFARRQGWEVHVISSGAEGLREFCEESGCTGHDVPMARGMAPWTDAVSIVRLCRLLRSLRPHVVEAHMSKAGLLAMSAAWLARIPVRIYDNQGVAFSSSRGWHARLLKAAERLTCRLATQVHCASFSVRELMIRSSCSTGEKIKVLASGSYGVDAAARFNPTGIDPLARSAVRQSLEIPADAAVIGFVGRIMPLKGIPTLTKAWSALREEQENAYLLLVGAPDSRQPLPAEVWEPLRVDPRVRITGWVSDTSGYYAAMDVQVLPSLHEGLPVSLLEGAAMQIPAVASRIPGNVDAVVDGVTGTLVPVQDADALAEAIGRYLRDPELRRRHGEAGRQRVLRDFQPERIWEAQWQEYQRLLQEKGIRVPAAEVSQTRSRAA